MLETKTRTETGQWKSWHHFVVFSQCMFCSPAWRCLYNVEWKINNHSLRPSTDVIQLTLTLKMTTAQVVETSVTVNNNSPIQDYVHPDDQPQPAYEMTPGGSNPGHIGGSKCSHHCATLAPKPCTHGNSRAWPQLHRLARYDWLIWLSKSFLIG